MFSPSVSKRAVRVRWSRLVPERREGEVYEGVGIAEVLGRIERAVDFLTRQDAADARVLERRALERDPLAQRALARDLDRALRVDAPEPRTEGDGQRFGHQCAAREIEVPAHAILVDLEAGERLADMRDGTG